MEVSCQLHVPAALISQGPSECLKKRNVCAEAGNRMIPPGRPVLSSVTPLTVVGIAESEREGTRAETRIGLSAKRTSPFKSAGGQFSRLLAAEECG